MATFPNLSSGAVAQYSSGYESKHGTGIVRYVDGSEQRYPLQADPVRRWTICLQQLSPAERASVEAFFRVQRGREGTFAFTDPWTGAEHAACCFDRDTIAIVHQDEWSASTEVVIREVRS